MKRQTRKSQLLDYSQIDDTADPTSGPRMLTEPMGHILQDKQGSMNQKEGELENEIEEQTLDEQVEPDQMEEDMPTLSDLEQGEIAELEYRWAKMVGRGTFGVVYEAVHLPSRQTVAVKKVFQDPKCRNRELSVAKDLIHPNIVRIRRHFFSREPATQSIYLHLVMDYLPHTLYRLLRYYSKQSKHFPATLAKLCAYQLLRSLAYLRAKKVLHRDVKPANVLVDLSNYKMLLCDFGSAKPYMPLEESVAYICSRFYRAPELLLGERAYGPDIDTWALGCLIAELVLGEPLFCGNNNKEQFLRVVHILGPPTEEDLQGLGYTQPLLFPSFEPITLQTKLGPHIDPQLIDLLSGLLMWRPDQRLHPFAALAHPYFDELRAGPLLVNGRSTPALFDFTADESQGYEHLLSRLVPPWAQTNPS